MAAFDPAAARGLRLIDSAARASFPGRFPAEWLAGAGLRGRAGELAAAINRPARLYLERPGKMLRPMITCLLLEAFKKDPRAYKEVLGAIELIEAATVSFDDIIDGSDLRRGGPATHIKHGVNNAYLAYQAAYNWAYRAFLSPALELEPWRRDYLLKTLAGEIFAYGYGQALELYWTARRREPSPAQYLAMSWDRIRFLSFNGPFRIGALLGGAAKRELPSFEKAGSWLGMAYHLHGDELNLFPRSGEWGKPLADDITCGRYTYLYLSAIRLSPPGRRARLRQALGDRRISAAALENVIDIVRASGAVEENRRMIGVFYLRAAAAIGRLKLPEKYRAELLETARYMAHDRPK
jgi:geranylgeranyl pyrophosphate synthase